MRKRKGKSNGLPPTYITKLVLKNEPAILAFYQYGFRYVAVKATTAFCPESLQITYERKAPANAQR